MTTSTKLWLGFGILAAVLMLLGAVSLFRLQTIHGNVADVLEVARVRSVTARELEINATGYAFSVLAYAETRDLQFRQAAAANADQVRTYLGVYERLATIPEHEELAVRFGALWHELESFGNSLLDSARAGREDQDTVRRLAYLRYAIDHFLDEEMKPNAVSRYESHRDATLAHVQAVREFVFGLLVLGMGITLITSVSVVRGILGAERDRERLTAILDAFVASAPLGLAVLDTNLRFRRINETLADLCGRSVDDCVGRPVGDASPATQPALEPLLRRVVEGGDPVHGQEVDVLLPEGRKGPETWVVSLFPVSLPGRGITGVGIAALDISARKRAESDLRRSELHFRTLADAMPQLVWTAEPDGSVDYFNERARLFDGFEWNETAQCWRWNACIHPDDRARTEQAWAEALAAGGDYQVEHRVRLSESQGGGYRWFLSRALPVRDEAGRIIKWFGTATDIHSNKEAEAALRASEELNRSTLQALPAHIAVLDRRGRIIAVNQAWSEFAAKNQAGDSSKVAVGADYLGVCRRSAAAADAGAARALAGIQSVLDGTLAQFTLEYPCHSPREQRWFFMTAVPLDPHGEGGTVVTHLNITERKLAEQELKEADRRKNEFLAMLAHELRNPLAPIGNAVEILKLQDSDGPASRMAREMIERQLHHMVRLVDDLLDVSRITRGKLQLRRHTVLLSDVLEQALEATRPLVNRAGQQLDLELPAEPIELDADPVRLSQVFLNLLNNASKYTERGGRICLSARRDASDVVVSVADTGIGISAEHLPEVFRMFAQVGPSLERGQGGLGIGLALARGLVEMHGGSIEAHSAGVGKGSEFIVRLPVLSEVPAPAPAPAVEGAAEGAGRRILVADDNRDNAQSLAMLLQLQGNEVETVYDGLEAVEAVERYHPDVVLLDIGMPKMDGYAACRLIREQPGGRDIRIIALTGWGQDEDRRKSKEAGFDDHLVKPVAPATLLSALAALQPEDSRESAAGGLEALVHPADE
jgi:PAS domain S-box-containing protein